MLWKPSLAARRAASMACLMFAFAAIGIRKTCATTAATRFSDPDVVFLSVFVVCNYGGHARYSLEDAAALQADTGLVFSQEDGTLSGTPTCAGYGERALTVTAFNRAGSDSSHPRLLSPCIV